MLTCMKYSAIGVGGAVALARALDHNSSIAVLDLRVRRGRRGARENRCAKILVFDTHIHAAQHVRRRWSGGDGEDSAWGWAPPEEAHFGVVRVDGVTKKPGFEALRRGMAVFARGQC